MTQKLHQLDNFVGIFTLQGFNFHKFDDSKIKEWLYRCVSLEE